MRINNDNFIEEFRTKKKFMPLTNIKTPAIKWT